MRFPAHSKTLLKLLSDGGFEVREACEAMSEAIGAARIAGFAVQKMARPGLEVIVGGRPCGAAVVQEAIARVRVQSIDREREPEEP